MADAAGGHGEDEDQHCPGNTDLGGLLQGLLALQRHEAHDDMGHAEVAQAPAQTGDNVLPVGEEVPVALGQVGHGGGGLAAVDEGQGEDGGDQQRAQHQHALEEVGPAHGGEAAQEGVTDDDDGGQVHSHGGVHADDGVEQGAAGLDGGGGVDGVGHQEDDGADDLQQLTLGEEAVGQILGDGDGVVGHDGKAAQTGRFHQPADGVADAQADGDPGLADTGGVDGGGQAHEDPGAHIAGAGRQCRHPGAHLAAAQEVGLIAAVLGAEEEIDTDTQHKHQVDNKDNGFNVKIHVDSLLWILLRGVPRLDVCQYSTLFPRRK